MMDKVELFNHYLRKHNDHFIGRTKRWFSMQGNKNNMSRLTLEQSFIFIDFSSHSDARDSSAIPENLVYDCSAATGFMTNGFVGKPFNKVSGKHLQYRYGGRKATDFFIYKGQLSSNTFNPEEYELLERHGDVYVYKQSRWIFDFFPLEVGKAYLIDYENKKVYLDVLFEPIPLLNYKDFINGKFREPKQNSVSNDDSKSTIVV